MKRAIISIVSALLIILYSAIPISAAMPQVAACSVSAMPCADAKFVPATYPHRASALSMRLAPSVPASASSMRLALPVPAPAPEVYAAAGASVDSASSVTLSHSQTEFQIAFSVRPSGAHAGAEFALQCPDGISVKSVRYGGAFGNRSSAGPSEARGLVWFTYFSGKNDFSGEVTATVTFTYSGKSNTSVVLDHVDVFTKNGEMINTQTAGDRRVISIYRDGADNEIPPIDPPPVDPPGDSGQSPAESTGDGANNGAGGSGTGTGGTGQNRNSGAPSGSLQAPGGDVPSGAGGNEAGAGGSAANPGNSELSDPAAPLSPAKTDTQSEGQSPWLMILVALLAVSILTNLTLGYFLIKRKHIAQ